MHVATFTLELKSPARKDNTHAIRLRITKFREHAYWNLGRYVLKADWNKTPKRNLKNWVIAKSNDDAPQINAAIDKAWKGLEKIADDHPALTAAGIKEAYQKELNPEAEAEQVYRNFFAFADELIARKKEKNFRTGNEMSYSLAALKELAGGNTPLEYLLSPKMLHKFVQAMKAKGNGPYALHNKLKDLRTIYNAGVREKQLPDIGKPFQEFRVLIPKKKRTRPTAEQIRQFMNYQPENEIQAIAKNVAMLQYLLQGARIGEALTLEWENVHPAYVEYLPQKEASRPKFVPRSRLLNKLLEEMPKGGRYVLPYIGEDHHTMPKRNKEYRKKRVLNRVNKGLQEIADKLEMNIALTSHMFRHAFADAVAAGGANIRAAAALLGHANPKTTEAYFKDLALEDTSELALNIFDKLEENLGEQ